MVIHYHVTLPMVSVNQPQNLFYFSLVYSWFLTCLYITKLFWTNDKNEDSFWIKRDFIVHSTLPNKSDTTYGIKETRFPYIHAPHTQIPHNPSLSRFEFFPHAQAFSSSIKNLYMQHNIPTFLLQIPMASTCIQDNQIPFQFQMNTFQRNYCTKYFKNFCYNRLRCTS